MKCLRKTMLPLFLVSIELRCQDFLLRCELLEGELAEGCELATIAIRQMVGGENEYS